MFDAGDIVRFGYLSVREADAGEESGRKARPVCVVVRTPNAPAALFLFPITSQEPAASRAHIAISEIECKRGGLGFPSYLVLDEYNRVMADEAYDFESSQRTGAFSNAFLRRIAESIKEISERKRLRGVVRR